MTLNVEIIRDDSAAIRLSALQLPFWCDPKLCAHSGTPLVLQATKGDEIVGIWTVPTLQRRGTWFAEREVRCLPYCSPWLRDSGVSKRREVFLKLMNALVGEVSSVVLPLSPEFTNISGAIEVGAFAEWRHTYRLTFPVGSTIFHSGRVSNHLRAAESHYFVTQERGIEGFDFERAIHTDSSYHFSRRKAFALHLHREGKAQIFRCQDQQSATVGEALVVIDNGTAYFMHSWFSRDARRGVPTFLLSEIIRWCEKQPSIKVFDFEGSILATVDRFMASFNAPVAPYAMLYWARDQAQLFENVKESLAITGRITS